MLERLIIEGSEETPNIVFDSSAPTLTISGKSLPENAFSFYQPVITWLKSYIENPNEETILEVNLEYFNSGSLKQVFNVLFIMEELVARSKTAKIVWKYKKGDELMLEKGIEFEKFLDVQVELVEY
jgi:hypothetical protein